MAKKASKLINWRSVMNQAVAIALAAVVITPLAAYAASKARSVAKV